MCISDRANRELAEGLERLKITFYRLDIAQPYKDANAALSADREKLYLTGKKQLQPRPVKGHKPLKDIASLPLEDWCITVSVSYTHLDVYKRQIQYTQ